MGETNRTANNVEPFFHPVSHYGSPDDVVGDARLSTEEKRLILSSWASDMYAVEAQPALREVPGIPQKLRLDDILAALKQLDEETDPPPRGGMAMRLPHFSRLDCNGSPEPSHGFSRLDAAGRYRSIHSPRAPGRSRWTREENVLRYRKLLRTHLTDLERKYIERRLAEELQA